MVYYNPAVHKDTAKQTGQAVNPGSVSGFGGLAYESPWQLDKKYWTTGNTGSVQYQKAAGQILRNGYYRVAANITGLVGQDCQVSVTVADWETPVTQSVDLGA